MKYAPIIVLVILTLGIIAVTIYRPHGSPRVNSIGTSFCIELLLVGPMPAHNCRT